MSPQDRLHQLGSLFRHAAAIAFTTIVIAAPVAAQLTTEPKTCDPAWENVLTYGATPDDETDDRDAIQAAIDIAAASGGTVCIPAGTFLLERRADPDDGFTNPQAVLLWLRSGVSIVGTGSASVLKVGDDMNDHVGSPQTGHAMAGGFLVFRYPEGVGVSGQRIDDLVLRDFTIDGNDEQNLLAYDYRIAGAGHPEYYPNGQFVVIRYGSQITIEGCRFINSNSRQVLRFGSGTDGAGFVDHVSVRNNVFLDHAKHEFQNDHSAIVSFASDTVIEANLFSNASQTSNGARVATAIEVHASETLATRNTVQNYLVGANIAATVTDPTGIEFIDNDLFISTGFSFWVFPPHTMNDVTLRDNTVTETFFEMPYGFKSRLVRFHKVWGVVDNLVVEDNVFSSTVDVPSDNRKTTGISLHGYAKRAQILGNTFSDLPCQGIDLRGPKSHSAPGPDPDLDDILISGNEIENAGSWGKKSDGACRSAVSLTMASSPAARNLTVENNDISYTHQPGNPHHSHTNNNGFRLRGAVINATFSGNDVTGVANHFSFPETSSMSGVVILHHDTTSSESPGDQGIFACAGSKWKNQDNLCWEPLGPLCGTVWTPSSCLSL